MGSPIKWNNNLAWTIDMGTSALRRWIPSALITLDDQWLARWLFTGDLPFTDPFFDETILKCTSLPENTTPFRCLGDLSCLEEWAASLAAVPPSAIIFHISRCGSTVLSQLLGLDPCHIVLSEVPFIDALLRLPYNKPLSTDVRGSVPAAVRFYGQQRSGEETRLFIKTDSWHLFFYQQWRRWYPHTPFILLYRSPDDVLASQRRRRGMHGVPGVLEADMMGINASDLVPGDLDGYMAKVLERYLDTFLEIAQKDALSWLANYNEGIPAIVSRIADVTHTVLHDTLREQMAHRSQYHGKYPQQLFSETKGAEPVPSYLATAMDRYQQLDEWRLAH